MMDGCGKTALMRACQGGHARATRVLLADLRVDVNVTNNDLKTAVMYAVMYGDALLVKLLLADERVDPYILNQKGYTGLLTMAIQMGNVAVARLLLEDGRADPNEWPYTAVKYAVLYEQASVMMLLLADKRVQVHMNMNRSYSSEMLRFAVRTGKESVVTTLLANELVDPNMTDDLGRTMFMTAASSGKVKMLELLLANDRVTRLRPVYRGNLYDIALFTVKYARRIRLRGLVRAVAVFSRMRRRAAAYLRLLEVGTPWVHARFIVRFV